MNTREEMQRAKDNSYATWQALSRAKVKGKLLTDAYDLYESIRGAQEQYENTLKEEAREAGRDFT